MYRQGSSKIQYNFEYRLFLAWNWVIIACSGLLLADTGWFWLVLAGCGWFLAGCGWLRVVAGGCGWLPVLSLTVSKCYRLTGRGRRMRRISKEKNTTILYLDGISNLILILLSRPLLRLYFISLPKWSKVKYLGNFDEKCVNLLWCALIKSSFAYGFKNLKNLSN